MISKNANLFGEVVNIEIENGKIKNVGTDNLDFIALIVLD